MFQGEACRRRINSTEDAAKCTRAGTNWLRRFYMVERISLHAFLTDSRVSGGKPPVCAHDPDPKPSAVPAAIRVGSESQTWPVQWTVSRLEPCAGLSRIALESSHGFSVDPSTARNE